MALFVFHKHFLQMHMHKPSSRARWLICLVGSFIYFHTSCVRTAKALVRLRECAGSPEPSLVTFVISNIISWAGTYVSTYSLLHTTNQTKNKIFFVSPYPTDPLKMAPTPKFFFYDLKMKNLFIKIYILHLGVFCTILLFLMYFYCKIQN